MKNILLIIAAAIIAASCGNHDNNAQGAKLTAFDACSCATLQDMKSEDYAKCKELRKDAQFETDYQKCKIAQKSGITDTSRLTIQNAENATNLKSANAGVYTVDITTSTLKWTSGQNKGEVRLKSGTLKLENNNITGGSLVIDAASMVNATGERATKFGEASFVITSGTAKNAIQYELKGNLTIDGTSKEVTCNVVVAPNGADALNVGGGFLMNGKKFDELFGKDKLSANGFWNSNVMFTINLKAKKSAV